MIATPGAQGGEVGFIDDGPAGVATALLSENGRRLQVWAAESEASFLINGCRFVHYDGRFRSIE